MLSFVTFASFLAGLSELSLQKTGDHSVRRTRTLNFMRRADKM